MKKITFLALILNFSIVGSLKAMTPVISEFMALNDSKLPLRKGQLLDEDRESSDWIEIYNPTDEAINLDGWYLTDDADDLRKWEFPSVWIESGRFKIIFASGKDRNDPAAELHTNFKLSGSGEFLALVESDGTTIAHSYDEYPQQFAGISYGRTSDAAVNAAGTVLLAEQADAKALIPADDTLDLDWTSVEFDDSDWLTGRTGAGYDYGALVNLDVSAMRGVNQSVYVRIPFEADDVSHVDQLLLKMKYEDGFMAFLNGRLVASANAPEPERLAFNSGATANRPDQQAIEFEAFDLSFTKDVLRTGRNVLAVQGLNVTLSSSDLLVLPQLTAIQTETAPVGDVLEGYFFEPTPGAVNSHILSSLGPSVRIVTHSPHQPAAHEDLIITAEVQGTVAPVSEVHLALRINFAHRNRWPPGNDLLPMVDDGSGADAVAGDDVYSVAIPSMAYNPGDMIRWYVSALDVEGRRTRDPLFPVPDNSPEYHGTVVKNPALRSGLPVLYWFTEDPGRANTRSGTRACVFFDGEFYDNVFVRQRGGYTARDSQKFVFNNGFKFRFSDEYDRVQEFNFNENGSDSSYLRQPLAFETMRNADCPASLSFLMLSVLNGSVDRVGIFIEQVDKEFLRRNGFQPDGALYKFVQRSSITPVFNDIHSGIEKKTRKHEDFSDIAAVVKGLNAPTEQQRRIFVFDHFNLPEMMNYLAARCLLQDTDDIRKNFYFYRDTNGTGEWAIFPWDKDWTFGVVGDGWIYTTHPFLGADSHPKNDARQWSIYLSVMYHLPETQEMFLRRLRTVMDTLLQPPGTPSEQLLFENRIDEMFASAKKSLPGSTIQAVNSLKNYFPTRRIQLYIDHNIHNVSHSPPGGNAGIPNSQPADATINFGRIDYNPASGNQDEEYIELINPNNYAVDISDWKLTGGIEHTFLPGTVIVAGGSLYVCPDSAAFRARNSYPTGGRGLFVQGNYKGHLSSWGETVELFTHTDQLIDRMTYTGHPSEQQRYLRITELMYHPAQAGSYDKEEYEFIELQNIGPSPLHLGGVQFTDGIDYTFTSDGRSSLPPGGYIVIVKNFAAFSQRYDTAHINIAPGVYTGSLSNAGESIKLEDRTHSTILEFSYDDNWYPATDGEGFSLTIRDPSHPDLEHWDNKESWRPSADIDGSPGRG